MRKLELRIAVKNSPCLRSSVHDMYTVFQKNQTPKTDWHNFVKIRPL